jgi:branched-chain amino acid transport system permease protein
MLQTLLNGLVQGLLFAVIGVAFSLVYSTSRVFYLALGATFTVAPYVFIAVTQAALPWWLGIGITLLVAAALGLAAEQFIHWPLDRSRAPGEVHLIASLGAFLVVGQVVVLTWGSDAKVLRPGVDTVYQLGALRVTEGQTLAVFVSVAILAALAGWFRWSDVGLQVRAMASNARLLATLGRDVRALRRGAFALSGVLASTAALLAARDLGFDPNVGMRAVLVGVAATIVGGRGSFVGAAVAGLVFGVLRAQVVWHSSARWEDAATFAVLALILLVLPTGLSGALRGRTRIEDTP